MAVFVAGFLFALSQGAQDTGPLLDAASVRMGMGHFLIMALLAVMRLVHGNLYWGTGVLSGWIMALRIIEKTVLTEISTGGRRNWIPWTIPQGHPEQGLAL